MTYKPRSRRASRNYTSTVTPTANMVDSSLVEQPVEDTENYAHIRPDLMRIVVIATLLVVALVALSFVF